VTMTKTETMRDDMGFWLDLQEQYGIVLRAADRPADSTVDEKRDHVADQTGDHDGDYTTAPPSQERPCIPPDTQFAVAPNAAPVEDVPTGGDAPGDDRRTAAVGAAVILNLLATVATVAASLPTGW